ncbi:phosphoribosylaminoimidazolesuccinocarboxamide synthase [Legionella longbeachae]|uniref:Phosphoribosylaminoimidazole-succinocarboxamide synthase n=1 Tax=Legionella longbeachae serogroup 1 (strain NSW150) TaxID=661367 RepID=D3HMP1_LEGLN|nr:phosphoribosylaminoimidazolesuccinocarboxamide synthase [Legionella longbeachae]VEE04242.1 phosphoribosylamidoimidazole-succinocarboxamide synthase [Legionella oakridgensis]HBD7397012.1 phosphoribosylaminoimidazolesuccinocarboxamide synthase [Legionella pneumophila]ARB92930.1 phosphoribosylaminoimidazolesuccinocarboxamide synthase [Legionella longbeachae]ARM33930.1 phosphoribosylaminoimidazolesuccinocarboxamide synthase [Legionella longbeachae]EEZ96867.1 phosphoribosylaminoimidazole-succino
MLMNATTTLYHDEIQEALAFCLDQTNLPAGEKYQGKVRDAYDLGDAIMLVTTDRLSAFDRHLALIPYKGAVLNLTSAWWFEQTKNLVPNHIIAVPDPNVVIAKKCTVFPIEFVVRGYISGTTSTSLWTQYQNGTRDYCGITFPEGLRKNQKLEQAVLTPTTKEKIHDRPISPDEIISEGWMSEEDWLEVSALALKLYQRGAEIARDHGLILVDTKYEFGRDAEGTIRVVDEIHTPDSSRYWLADSYQSRIAAGLEPENIDKEFLRLWFAKNSDPYHDEKLPEAPQELVVELSARYIQLYERITGKDFNFNAHKEPAEQRILRHIANYLR